MIFQELTLNFLSNFNIFKIDLSEVKSIKKCLNVINVNTEQTKEGNDE